MAGIKVKIKKPDASTLKSWKFVLVSGVVLALLAMFDSGGIDLGAAAGAGSTECRLEVADQLNVRSQPSAESELLETLPRGAVVDGTRVVTDGFRELSANRWAANQFLTPLPGTSCA